MIVRFGVYLVLVSCLVACGFQKKKSNDENNNDDTRREMELASDSTVGNGADSVICEDKAPELLDAYEMREFRDLEYSVGSGDLTVKEKVNVALDRLSKKDQLLADRMRVIIENWDAEVKFFEDVHLPNVEDSGNTIPLLDGCHLEQLAIQYRKVFPHDKRIIVDKKIWDEMSRDDQAALVVHETYYRLAFEKGHEDSRAVRYFTSLVMSDRLDQLSLIEYSEIVGELELPGGTMMIGDFEVDMTALTLYPSGEIKSAITARRAETNMNGQSFTVESETALDFYQNGSLLEASLCFDSLSFPNQECMPNENGRFKIGERGSFTVPHSKESKGRIQFFPSGNLKRVVFDTVPNSTFLNVDIPVPGSGVVNRAVFHLRSLDSISFYDSGVPHSLDLLLDFPTRGLDYKCKPSLWFGAMYQSREIEFHPNGYVSYGRVSNSKSPNTVCETVDGQEVKAEGEVRFDQNGYLISQ